MRLRFVPLVLALAAASCRAHSPTAPNPTIVAVQVLYPQPFSAVVAPNDYDYFAAFAIRSDGAWEDVSDRATWASSAPHVLGYTGVGQGLPGSFQALAPGRVTITATYQSFVGSLPVTVVASSGNISFPGLFISGGNPGIAGATAPVQLMLYSSASSSTDVTSQASWTSADPSVVIVQNGIVTAVGPGTTTIRATYNGMTASYALSVFPRL